MSFSRFSAVAAFVLVSRATALDVATCPKPRYEKRQSVWYVGQFADYDLTESDSACDKVKGEPGGVITRGNRVTGYVCGVQVQRTEPKVLAAYERETQRAQRAPPSETVGQPALRVARTVPSVCPRGFKLSEASFDDEQRAPEFGRS